MAYTLDKNISIDCTDNPLIICIRYGDNTIISQEIVRSIILKIMEIADGKKFAIVANFHNVVYVEQEARQMFAYKPDNLIAVAVVFDNEKQSALKKIFLVEVNPEYKLEFFGNEQAAKNWLVTQFA